MTVLHLLRKLSKPERYHYRNQPNGTYFGSTVQRYNDVTVKGETTNLSPVNVYDLLPHVYGLSGFTIQFVYSISKPAGAAQTEFTDLVSCFVFFPKGWLLDPPILISGKTGPGLLKKWTINCHAVASKTLFGCTQIVKATKIVWSCLRSGFFWMSEWFARAINRSQNWTSGSFPNLRLGAFACSVGINIMLVAQNNEKNFARFVACKFTGFTRLTDKAISSLNGASDPRLSLMGKLLESFTVGDKIEALPFWLGFVDSMISAFYWDETTVR